MTKNQKLPNSLKAAIVSFGGNNVPKKTDDEKKSIAVQSKIAQRIKQAVHETQPPPNATNDLPDLITEYRILKKRLASLIKSLRKYADTTAKMNKARDQVRTKTLD